MSTIITLHDIKKLSKYLKKQLSMPTLNEIEQIHNEIISLIHIPEKTILLEKETNSLFIPLGMQVDAPPNILNPNLGMNSNIFGRVIPIFGCAGSGKTSILTSMAHELIKKNIAVLQIDVFGIPSRMNQIFGLLSASNLEKQHRIINLNHENSHCINLISGMDSEDLVEWLINTLSIQKENLNKKEMDELCHLFIEETPLNNRDLATLISFSEQKTITKQTQFLIEKLKIFTENYKHVFNQPLKQNLEIKNSIEQHHLISVFLPCAEKQEESERFIISNGILNSYLHALKKTKFKSFCIIPDFRFSTNSQFVQNFTQHMHQNHTLIFGGQSFQDLKPVFFSTPTIYMPIKILLKVEDVNQKSVEEPQIVKKLEPINLERGMGHIIEKTNLYTCRFNENKAAEKIPSDSFWNFPFIPNQKPWVNVSWHHQPNYKKMLNTLKNEINTLNGKQPSLAWCQETISKMFGFAHFYEAQKQLKQ